MQEPEIIEAEIVEKTDTSSAGRGTVSPVVSATRSQEPPFWHTPGDHARPYGDTGGLISGFLVLAVGFLVTVCVALFSLCVVVPTLLLTRLLGLHKHK